MNFVRCLMVSLILICVRFSIAFELGPIERDHEGLPLTASINGAKEYCERKGERVPTAREYVEFNQKYHGARLIESSYKNHPIELPEVAEEIREMRGKGYYAVFTDRPGSGPLADFYVDTSNYEGWSFDIFWTSTEAPDSSHHGEIYYYVQHAYYGIFVKKDDSWMDRWSFRCTATKRR